MFRIIEIKQVTDCSDLNEDDFIVFNGNRNQFRKRIDITISAFAKFAVGRPDTKLYLHMGMKDMGWDVMPLFKREMARQGLDANNRIIMTTPQGGAPAVPLRRDPSLHSLRCSWFLCFVRLFHH